MLHLSACLFVILQNLAGKHTLNLLHGNSVPLISMEPRQLTLPPCRRSQKFRLSAHVHFKGVGAGKWEIFPMFAVTNPQKNIFFL